MGHGAKMRFVVAQLVGAEGQGAEFTVVYRSHFKRADPLGTPDLNEPTGVKQVEVLADQVIVAKRVHKGPKSTAR